MYDALICRFQNYSSRKTPREHTGGPAAGTGTEPVSGFCLRIPQKTEVTGSSLRTAARRMHGLLRIRINILHTVLKE